MNPKIIVLFLFITLTHFVKGQTLEIVISDTLNQPVFAAEVYINGIKKEVYNGGVITIKANAGDILEVKSYFYTTYTKTLNSVLFSSKTTRLHVKLLPKTQNLDEIIITGKQISAFYDVQNSNVTDYYPYSEFCLFLLKEKNQRFIQLNKGSKIITKTKLNFKPKELYLDGFGNFHILSKDSVYQIWITTDKIEHLSPVSLAQFNAKIRPLIGKTKHSIFTQKHTAENKFYTVSKISKDSIIDLYTTYDKIAYKMAMAQKSKIIYMYNAVVPTTENIISAGIWDGDVKKLQTIHDMSILDEIGWYISALNAPIKCEAFGTKNYITVVDMFHENVLMLDYLNGNIIKKSKLNNPTQDQSYVFYDYFIDVIYLIDKTKKGVDIYELNPRNGNTTKLKGVYGTPLIKNIKIAGDWVYFEIRESSGFNKILRQRIR